MPTFLKSGGLLQSEKNYIGVGVTAGIPCYISGKTTYRCRNGSYEYITELQQTQDSYHREERMSVESRLHVKSRVEYNGKNLHTINLNIQHNRKYYKRSRKKYINEFKMLILELLEEGKIKGIEYLHIKKASAILMKK